MLSRKHFPHLALVKENVVLITPEEHQLLDMGTIEQRERYAGENGCEWNKIEQIKEKLLCRK